jgi:hypothetical protein
LIILLEMPAAHALSVWIGVAGCGCPISMKAVPSGTASRALWNKSPNYASVVEAITLAIIELMVCTGPLYGGGGFLVGFYGSAGLLLRKKAPPARLLVCASDK